MHIFCIKYAQEYLSQHGNLKGRLDTLCGDNPRHEPCVFSGPYKSSSLRAPC